MLTDARASASLDANLGLLEAPAALRTTRQDSPLAASRRPARPLAHAAHSLLTIESFGSTHVAYRTVGTLSQKECHHLGAVARCRSRQVQYGVAAEADYCVDVGCIGTEQLHALEGALSRSHMYDLLALTREAGHTDIVHAFVIAAQTLAHAGDVVALDGDTQQSTGSRPHDDGDDGE